MNPLDGITLELELEGFEVGTPEFVRALRIRKIGRCQEHKGVTSCGGCPYVMFCRLHQEHTQLERAYVEEQRLREEAKEKG